jgi:hypothetical protein
VLEPADVWNERARVKPVDAASQFLASCLAPLRAELEQYGVTVTIESSTDPKGAVVASYTFRIPRALAEKLASEPA